jgi:hypothetical protein
MSVSQKLKLWLERFGIFRPSPTETPPALVIELIPIVALIVKSPPSSAAPAALPAPPPAAAKAVEVVEWRDSFPTSVFAERFARWMSQQDGLCDTAFVLEEVMHYASEFADLTQVDCPSEMALTKAIGEFRHGAPRPWKYAENRKVRKQHYRFPSATIAKARPKRTHHAEDSQLSLLAA